MHSILAVSAMRGFGLKVRIVAMSDIQKKVESMDDAQQMPAWAKALFDRMGSMDDRLGSVGERLVGIEKAIKGLKSRVSDLESRQRTTQLAARFASVAPFADDLVHNDASLREQQHRRTPSSPYAQ